MIVGLAKFAELRLKRVLLSSQTPENSCGCKYHANVILLLEVCTDGFQIISLYIPKTHCCLSLSATWKTKTVCRTTVTDAVMVSVFGVLLDMKPEARMPNVRSVKWYQWIETERFIQKSGQSGTAKSAIDVLCAQLPKLHWYSYVKLKQAQSYKDALASAMGDSDSCALQMDFAENFTCI